jgi:hypothetical protein
VGLLNSLRKNIDRTFTLNGWDKKNDQYWEHKTYGKKSGQGAENNAEIIKALKILDRTHRWFRDENEANRELVTCLNAMGHKDAEYQPDLGVRRTPDAYFNSSIIEGKLNPHLSDVDRLMGQLFDYLTYPYFVHVVVYGYASDDILNRINFMVKKNPEKVFLAYNFYANRNRIQRR